MPAHGNLPVLPAPVLYACFAAVPAGCRPAGRRPLGGVCTRGEELPQHPKRRPAVIDWSCQPHRRACFFRVRRSPKAIVPPVSTAQVRGVAVARYRSIHCTTKKINWFARDLLQLKQPRQLDTPNSSRWFIRRAPSPAKMKNCYYRREGSGNQDYGRDGLMGAGRSDTLAQTAV
jgi:hypothetical protein